MEYSDTLKIHKQLPSDVHIPYYKPTVVGYFSLNSNQIYHEDLSQLRYVQLPSRLVEGEDNACEMVDFDLNKGWKKAKSKNRYLEGLGRLFSLDNVLRWFLDNFRELSVMPDIVCSRKLLALLMCTPYEKQNGWIICATKFRGILYLCQYMTDEQVRRREQETFKDKQMIAWGHKFEQYMCSDKPGRKPDTSQPVDEWPEQRVMFSTQLNGRHLLFGAEVDGILNQSEVKSCSDLTKATFVELKTNRMFDNQKQEDNFNRFKLLRWWSQCFVVGIERIVGGFRDDEGKVLLLKNFTVSQIPNKVNNSWDSNVCLNFCDQFLKFASDIMKDEGPTTVWKFEWRPRYDHVKAKKIAGPSEFSFLPPWFTDRSEICKKSAKRSELSCK